MYDQIDTNKRKTVFLIILFIIVIIGLGWVFTQIYPEFGYTPIIIAIVIAILMSSASYFSGDKVALAVAGAKSPLQRNDNPYVYRMVENLCITAGIPLPKIYIIPDQVMNAFATGRNPKKASIALTQGIINGLENEELEGVIAHELSHIKNYDIRLMTVIVVLVGIIALLADWMIRIQWYGGNSRRRSSNNSNGNLGIIFLLFGIILAILSPIIAELIKLAVSRKREFLADASGSLLTRYPEGLARALEKIGRQTNGLKHANKATAHLYIVNPFGAKAKKGFKKIWSTHPPIEERITRLRQMT